MLARVKELRETLLGDETRRKVVSWWRGEDIGATSDGTLHAGRQSEARAIATRIIVAEHLWGEGNLGPGDNDFLRELGAGLAFEKDMRVGYLGFGLGGAALNLVSECDVEIVAFDECPALADAARSKVAATGLSKRISLTSGAFEGLSLPIAAFDHVVAKDAFLRVADKNRLAEQIKGALKPGGAFLVSDYVGCGDPLTPEELSVYFPCERGAIQLVRDDESRTLLEAQGLEIRTSEDVTARLADDAAAGWSNLRKLLDGLSEAGGEGAERSALMRAIAGEAALWANRIEAFRSGRLAVRRHLAVKPA